MEVVYPCLTDTWELRCTVHKMGMKYCKRKIPRLRKLLLKVVISFPVIRENQEELDNEMWSVERSSCTTIALDRF